MYAIRSYYDNQGDPFDRLAGLVDGGVGHRDEVAVADGDRQRAVLGQRNNFV